MTARRSTGIVRSTVLATAVLTAAGAVVAAPASAAAKAVPVPVKADYTVVLSTPQATMCGLETDDGGSLSIRADAATLVMPSGAKLTGTIHRKGVTFSIRVSVKKPLASVVLLTGKVNGTHLLIGKSEAGGAFPSGLGWTCNSPFSGLLLPTAKTPCPTSAALFAVWRAQKPSPGTAVTGFGPVTCWRTWAVAFVRGRADGSAAFTRVPQLHLNTATEGAAFHQQVCNTASAPKVMKAPNVAGCL